MKHYLPAGMPARLDYPDRTVGDVLAGAARRFADRVALHDGDLALTFAEVHDHALRIAQGLRERGVRPGETVALHQPNSAWFTVTYYGVLLAGAVVTPVNPTLPPAALAEQLTEAGAVAAFTHPTTRAALQRARVPGLRLVVEVPDTRSAQPAQARGAVRLEDLLTAEPAPATAVSGDDLAHLSFTGGTTGRSKAVRVLHRNVVANTLQMACWRAGALPRTDGSGGLVLEPVPAARTPHTFPAEGSTSLSLAPMFHAMGLVSQNLSVLLGTTVVVFGRFDAEGYVRAVERHRVTSVPGSPSLFHALLALPDIDRADLSSVRVVNSGAAPIDPHTLARLHDLFPRACVIEGYGLTEATMALTTHPMERGGTIPRGSVGAPVFDTEIEIRALDGGAALPVGETGEVWARGPQIADGYQGHPELTAEQFRDGWLRTGDLGRLDEDGWLFLVGRAKDMLIYKGYNVYPTPLEDLLHRHPAVAQASVVGVPHPEAGEIPVAYVVPRAGHEAGPDLAARLMAHVAERVAPYQRVREVHFLESLPVSAAGKVLKTELRGRHRGDAAHD
ncbi:class I adenylate-forming enzyme family protein [Streptomyces sp. NPDC017979]|uniref:class I adenylate-forming enzyme family protein n=1 Tax=Streptomyces sp. NPDC017979 TaxID=3365024 RepID=UPI00379C849F